MIDAPPDPEGAARAPGRTRRGAPGTPAEEAAMVAGLRRGEEAAFVALYEGYAPLLLHLARRLRRGDQGAEQAAHDVIGDVGARLAAGAPPPARLAAYLASAFVRRLADADRVAARRRTLEDGAAEWVGGTAERVLRDVVSEYAVRASAGAGAEEGSRRLTPSIAALAAALEADCDERDRRLLALLAARVPQPEIARELGLEYGAARARIHRFRKRLWRRAAEYVASLPERERADVRRFLKRAGAPFAGASFAGATSAGGSAEPPSPSRARRAASAPETDA